MPATITRFVTALIILNALFTIIAQWPALMVSPFGLRSGLAYTPLDYAAERTAFIQQRVPRNVSIGFLTDQPPGAFEASRAFYEARYALAPRLLEPFSPSKHVWVMGDFEQDAAGQALAKQFGLTLISPPNERVKLYSAQPKTSKTPDADIKDVIQDGLDP